MRKPEEKEASVRIGDAAAYRMAGWAEAPVEAPAETNRRTAVLAVHGMGQQTPFSTLADVAEELRKQRIGSSPTARNVVISNGRDDVRLSRIELGDAVHVYEAWWAPLTEGAVTLRNVLSFLLHAAFSNMRRRRLTRHLFGKRVEFPVNLKGGALLYIAILTVFSLLVINTIMLTAVPLRLLGISAWPSVYLVVDLSVLTALLSMLALSLGVMVQLASHAKQFADRWVMGRVLRWLVWTEFSLLILGMILTAGAMVAAVVVHRNYRSTSVASGILGSGSLEKLARFSWQILVFLAAIAFISRIVKSAWLSRALLWVTVAANVATIALLVRRIAVVPRSAAPEPSYWQWGWVWILFFVVSVFARRFLVQYLGDVAAYVQPHRLDRFHAIREQIKQCIFDTANAVYRATDGQNRPLYDRIIIVAHSLGSVAAYDALNALLRIDAAHGGSIDVAGRTKLLITFGSPLDKIALLFGKQQLTEMDEALAATIQPLTQMPSRPRWINIHSRHDIISGPLEYFGGTNLTNLPDPDATTPLAAHTEYWKNELLWKTLARYV